MYRMSAAAAIAALVLAGCAADGSSPYQTNLQDLRMSSALQVDGYSKVTSNFLKTHTDAVAIEHAKRAVADSLKDPGSAQFKNVRLAPFGTGKVVCGEVNAKNSYGGYVGYTRFVASTDSSTLASRSLDSRFPEIDAASDEGVDTACP